MTKTFCACAALALALFASPPAAAHLDAAPAAGDCRQARDPRRCDARAQAKLACADQRGEHKRRCLAALLPPPDCTRAPQIARCQALAAARAACQGLRGSRWRRCLQQRLPDGHGYQAG